MFGMPYIKSRRADRRAHRRDGVSGSYLIVRHARPAGPEPMTATDLPFWSQGYWYYPAFVKASVNNGTSMFLMVTAGSVIPNTQAPSQGAGQTRPVNSGKLLVLCSDPSAHASGRDRPGHSTRESDYGSGSHRWIDRKVRHSPCSVSPVLKVLGLWSGIISLKSTSARGSRYGSTSACKFLKSSWFTHSYLLLLVSRVRWSQALATDAAPFACWPSELVCNRWHDLDE